jgi:hypothetical protein
MSQTIFPTLLTNTFIPQLWSFSTEFTREYADLHYVKFPIAQGSQTFPLNLNVNGITTLGETQLQTRNSTQSSSHYLNFSDSSATGVGHIQKSANFSVNPSTGIFTTSGLTMSGASNITLSNGTATPTSGQLGYIYSGAVPGTTVLTNGGDRTLSTISSVNAGTYMIFGNFTYSIDTANVSIIRGYFQTSSGIIIGDSITFGRNALVTTNGCINMSTCFTTTTSLNYSFIVNITYITGGVSVTPSTTNFVFKMVRIS